VGDIKDVKLGLTQVNKIFCGVDLVFEKVTDTTPPTTTPRPYDTVNNPTNTYTSAQTVYLDVNEASDTYYTTDGSTPTTASTKYTGGILIETTTTLKYFSVDKYGNAEAVKTTTYTIEVPSSVGWRYLKIEGYGSVEEPATTRMIEVEAWEGSTNRMTGATILSNEAVSTGGAVTTIKDGVKTTTSGSYPIWWTSPTPNGNVVVDLLAQYELTKLNYYSYSVTNVQRANRFRILASNTNNGTDWTTLWDMSANTTPQPLLPNGYELVL